MERLSDLNMDHSLNESQLLIDQSDLLAKKAYAKAMRDIGKKGDLEDRPELLRYIDETTQDTFSALYQQIFRNQQQAEKHLRNVALQVQMVSDTRNWKRSAALIAVRKNLATQFKFNFADRSGRRWDASKYVRTLLREHYVTLYNEVYLYALSKRNRLTAYVKNEDVNHKDHGTRFYILPISKKDPLYSSIKDQIFHPNTRSLVTAKL